MNSTSTYTRILDNLKFLKSTESINVIDKTMEYVNKNNLNFIDGFLYFTEAQVEQKKENLIRHSVCMAGFPKIKSLAEFEFDYQPSINKEQIYDLNSLRFIEKQENVVFYGNSGVGKTHLAVSLGMIAAQHRYSTYYINCHNLITQLNKAHYENRLQERLKNYAKYKVLIIDEIGYLPMDIQGANLFFQLIAKRYEKNTTIFTSNKAFSSWNEVFSDITLANAILDRLLHHSHVIKIVGPSYRTRHVSELINDPKD